MSQKAPPTAAAAGSASATAPSLGVVLRKDALPLYALRHAERAGVGLQSGKHFVLHAPSRGETPKVRILDVNMSQEMLQDDDGGEHAHFVKPAPPLTDFPYLLADALTTAGGQDWRRMRPAVEEALGGGLMVLRQRYSTACIECAEACCALIGAPLGAPVPATSEPSASPGASVMDVRVLAAGAAARGMTVAAVGGWGGDASGELQVMAGVFDRDAQQTLELGTRGLFTEDLRSRTFDEEKSQLVRQHTDRLVATALHASAAGHGSTARGGGAPGAAS